MSTYWRLVRLIAVVWLASASLIVVPVLAAAQAPVTSFDQVPTRVKIGDTVFVSDATGREVKGKVLDLSAASLALRSGSERQEFSAAQVKSLTWQKSDSLGNGALIGLAIGAGSIAVLSAVVDDCESDNCAAVVALAIGIGGGIGAGAGLLIDAAIPAKTVLIYRAPSSPSTGRISIVPILTPRRQGVVIRVSF
jgi:hypothetical protein